MLDFTAFDACSTPLDAWTRLVGAAKRLAGLAQHHFLQGWEDLRMEPTEDVATFLARVSQLNGNLAAYGTVLPNSVVIEHVIRRLPHRCMDITCTRLCTPSRRPRCAGAGAGDKGAAMFTAGGGGGRTGGRHDGRGRPDGVGRARPCHVAADVAATATDRTSPNCNVTGARSPWGTRVSGTCPRAARWRSGPWPCPLHCTTQKSTQTSELAALRPVLTSRTGSPTPGWHVGVGMGWLRTVRNGVPFVTAPSPLLDPLCLAALDTGIPFVGPLPVTLTLTLILGGASTL
eukprot:364792-Chlamydomonas_euryale.AAC.15